MQPLQEVLELVIEAARGLSLGRLGGHLALLQQEDQHRVQGVPGKKLELNEPWAREAVIFKIDGGGGLLSI